jgi:hypothetical protein
MALSKRVVFNQNCFFIFCFAMYFPNYIYIPVPTNLKKNEISITLTTPSLLIFIYPTLASAYGFLPAFVQLVGQCLVHGGFKNPLDALVATDIT